MNDGDIVSMIYDARNFVLRFQRNDEKIMITDIVKEVDLDYKLCVIVCCCNKESMKIEHARISNKIPESGSNYV